MKVAILGFSIEGHASYDYFRARGDELTICDQNTEVEIPGDATSQLGDDYLNNLDRFDLLIRTPGLRPDTILATNPNVADKITTQIDQFLIDSPTKNIIGVTGTKGKGTTSTLITMMLEATGQKVSLGGNIGIPPLTFIDKLTPESWVVLELSSFQLIDLKHSPHIAVCLMVVPEHLNWHKDLNEYIAAKQQLFAHQAESDLAIYFSDNNTSKHIARAGAGQKMSYYSEPGAVILGEDLIMDQYTICKTNEIKLLGEHNWQNICAAVTVVWSIFSPEGDEPAEALVGILRSVITGFSGLEHRLELVRELEEVSYYDDSFGTTPDTAIVAIKAFKQPKVIILGGSDKGANFDGLATAVKENNVRQVIIIGQMGPAIIEALSKAGYKDITLGGNSMAEIIDIARAAAQPGDVVLLSPACASFDMFKDYKDRGQQFKNTVTALAA
ncbi:MAG: UDP-N-acetylmuramoyl-L-alanine--D-glutamate ligase [Candidatus Saccharimonadales bacterium]